MEELGAEGLGAEFVRCGVCGGVGVLFLGPDDTPVLLPRFDLSSGLT